MPDEWRHWEVGRLLGDARPKTGVRSAPVVVADSPLQEPSEVVLSERDQEVHALPSEGSDGPLAERVSLRLAGQTENERFIRASQPPAAFKSTTRAGRPPMWRPTSRWTSPARPGGAPRNSDTSAAEALPSRVPPRPLCG